MEKIKNNSNIKVREDVLGIIGVNRYSYFGVKFGVN